MTGVWMEHPDLPGQPIVVDARNVAGHGASGWVTCDAPPSAPKASADRQKEAPSAADPDPEVPALEKPARRRAPKEAEEK